MQAISWVLDFSESTYGSRLVLLSIANHCDKFGTDAWPTLETIAQEARLGLRDVSYAINNLTELGELVVEKGKGQIGRNRYTLPKMLPANIAGESAQLNLQNGASVPANIAGLTCKMVHRNKEEPSYRPKSNRPIKFSVPQLDEVLFYAKEINAKCNPEEFFDYFTANGWKTGRHAMNDWKAAFRNWNRRSFNFGGNNVNGRRETKAEALARNNQEVIERFKRDRDARNGATVSSKSERSGPEDLEQGDWTLQG